MRKKLKGVMADVLCGLLIGTVNGAFGAGGGMLAVPLLKKKGMNQKKAQQNAVAIILPITVVSAAVYLFKGYVEIKNSLLYLPFGLIGAFLGTRIINKISPVYLKAIFGLFMLYAGGRLVFR